MKEGDKLYYRTQAGILLDPSYLWNEDARGFYDNLKDELARKRLLEGKLIGPSIPTSMIQPPTRIAREEEPGASWDYEVGKAVVDILNRRGWLSEDESGHIRKEPMSVAMRAVELAREATANSPGDSRPIPSLCQIETYCETAWVLTPELEWAGITEPEHDVLKMSYKGWCAKQRMVRRPHPYDPDQTNVKEFRPPSEVLRSDGKPVRRREVVRLWKLGEDPEQVPQALDEWEVEWEEDVGNVVVCTTHRVPNLLAPRNWHTPEGLGSSGIGRRQGGPGPGGRRAGGRGAPQSLRRALRTAAEAGMRRLGVGRLT